MQDLSIENGMNSLLNGRIRIPAFQRGFVWDADRVALFMDSLYKGYPFGALLLWRTRNALRTERKLGPYELPPGDPEYPIDYVLDGQQRLTSIFGVFQTSLPEQVSDGWLPIYFDLYAEPDAQETQFFAVKEDQVDPGRHFALKSLFDPAAYRAATKNLPEDVALKLDSMQKQFLQVTLPLQTFETDDQARVAIVFERVNRLGIALDALQLLTAWSWSEDFDLQEQFEELAVELGPFGFDAVGEDPNLLLRCCAAVISGDASPNALVSLNGAAVRTRFQEIKNGIKGAIDFLNRNLRVQSLKNLPYSTHIVPPCVFFAVPGNQVAECDAEQRAEILRWFWRSCFSRRYSSGVLRSLKTDISEMQKLKDRQPSNLSKIPYSVATDFFLENEFISSTVNTKTFVLLLAQQDPLSFVSGQPIDLRAVLRDYNRNEFHHCYPRAFMKDTKDEALMNRLVNFAFMSRADNRVLGGDAPSVYRTRMDTFNLNEILCCALCPMTLFDDDFGLFLEERNVMLLRESERLTG